MSPDSAAQPRSALAIAKIPRGYSSTTGLEPARLAMEPTLSASRREFDITRNHGGYPVYVR